MRLYTFYIIFFVITLFLNLLNQDKQEKFSSSNSYEVIHSGFLQSQSRAVVTDKKIIISCKFKSMNRKSSKSLELKNKISNSKI